MIYAVIESEYYNPAFPDCRDISAALYRFETVEDFQRATWTPDTLTLAAWTAGRYTRKKDRARAQLQALQEAQAAPGLSWYELAEIQARAENVARRAGLLREARENAIC